MLCFSASLLLTFLLQTPTLQIAVTQKGVHVQCTQAKVGGRQIQTPYGLWITPTDPVVAILDGRQQLKDFQKLRQTEALDDESWLQDLSTAGQLEELARAAMEVLAQQPQSLLPYTLLEKWGKHLDPAPRELPHKRRVAWLWKVVNSKDFTRAVMAGARLMEEVSFSSEPANDRIVLLADLRKALRSDNPVQRRVAAHVAGRQQEFSLRENLMRSSLVDPIEAARDAAAEGVHSIHAHSARQYWVRNLAQGATLYRESAAWNLGHYGGADGLNGLIHVLAAWNHKSGQRFDFAERRIWVVSDRDLSARDIAGFNPDQEEVDFRHLNPDLEFLDLGSTFKVTRYGESLEHTLLEALDAWADEKTGRDADAWLKFYLEEWLPSRP